MKIPPQYQTNTPSPLVVPERELIATLVEYGMPQKDARALLVNKGLLLMATRFYFDVTDMKRGDKEAKERVEYCQHMWNERSKVEKATKREQERVTISVPRSI